MRGAGWAGCVLAAALAACAPSRQEAPAFTDVTQRALGKLAGAVKTESGSVLLFDAMKDGRLAIFATGPGSGGVLLLDNGDGTFRDAGAALAGGQAAAAVDYDNDGRVDLLVAGPKGVSLHRNEGQGAFRDATRRAGLQGRREARSAVFADFDNSGLPDLFVPAPERNRLFKNLGNGSFQERGAKLGLAQKGRSGRAAVCDLDRDYDTDVLVAGPEGPVQVFRNERLRGLREEAADLGLAGVRGAGLVADDFDNDRIPDLLVLSSGCAPNRLFTRQGFGPFREAQPGRTDLGRGGSGAAAVDFDNDGRLDLLVSGSCSPGSGGFLLLRSRGDGGFADATSLLPIKEDGGGTGGSFALGDYDGDGAQDIVLLRRQGLAVLHNQAGARNHWLDVALIGAQGSSKDGSGAKVEVKAGGLWVQRELSGLDAGAGQAVQPLHFGLGRSARADMVRVTWPTGIRQSLADVPADETIKVREKGQKSSCPFLFAWDGERFRFVSDLLGAGFIGILTGPDTYFKPRSDEYLRLDSGLLQPQDGKYLLSLAERLEEADYFDQVRLVAVDHDPDVEVHPDEKYLMRPPWPQAKVVAVRGARPPVRAADDQGRDILPLLASQDRRFHDGFELLPYEGYAARHSVTLDLGDAGRNGRPAILLLRGYVRYWTSNSAFQASRRGLRLEPPSLEVRDRAGRWVKVVDDLGFPAGLPKTTVADLTGRFLSEDRSVRITTDMEVYWDQVRVASETAVPGSVRVTQLAPERAELGWLGYPRMVMPGSRPPVEYDYQDLEPSAAWRRPEGFYTDYGDVTELLAARDDRFVIMGHGEQVLLSFDANRLPPLPPGRQRDFFVYVDGFVKEMNPHTAYLHTVEPLPFHKMSNYPYRPDERYPGDAEHSAYRKRWNRRWVSGAPGRG
ncbi:MAG: CRTAC1 family protein [Elusimicrobia bacterium]|nr:CRTAC1 family protein [Elusimicrobiota bacterium]